MSIEDDHDACPLGQIGQGCREDVVVAILAVDRVPDTRAGDEGIIARAAGQDGTSWLTNSWIG